MSDELSISEDDVEQFRHKLSGWAAALGDADRAILQLILVRAFPEPEVAGFGFGPGFTGGERGADPGALDGGHPSLTPAMVDAFRGVHYGPGGVLTEADSA